MLVNSEEDILDNFFRVFAVADTLEDVRVQTCFVLGTECRKSILIAL